jgi:protein-L-isoaspartate O-methyltransferase
MSFLNIGSGTGYVSCIVADIMGSRSSHYGIEIHADVVQHSKTAIEEWKRSTASSLTNTLSIQILHGNGLDVISDKGESVIGFDRIYVGAAVERHNLTKLTRLLRPGGILVGPGKSNARVTEYCPWEGKTLASSVVLHSLSSDMSRFFLLSQSTMNLSRWS